MLRKICHFVFGLCMFAGFMFMVGTVGASDLNSIDLNTLLKQTVISLFFMVVGFFGLKLSDWEYID